MATKPSATAEAATPDQDGDTTLLDVQSVAVKRLIARGKERGYITFDELNAVLPPDQNSSEQIEDVMANFSELGIQDQEAETMNGVFVPAGTPKPIIELLQKEIAAVVHLPDVSSKLLELGIIPEGTSTADFEQYVKSEIAKWKKVIEDAKITKI